MWVPTCSPLRDAENDAEPLHHELLSTDLSVRNMEPRGIWRGWWELRDLLLPRGPEEGPHGPNNALSALLSRLSLILLA